jgi:hypothetical protein
VRQVAVHLGEAVPRTLLRRGVWRGDCALEELFAQRKRLAGGGRHRVWHCSGGEGGWEFAVKEYDLADARTCLREAALLVRLHHPAIVRVVAVFRNGDKIMMQMPYLEDGSVDVWVVAVPPPPWTAVRGVMHDVTGALAHLHASGVVHADVKPSNILIGPGGRGVLADFDIAVDSGARTTQQYLATTRHRVGWTPGFEAPELAETGSSAAADVFALGRTVAALRDKCVEAERAASAAEVDAFVAALTAREPEVRPSADEAGQHAFYRALLEQRAEQVSECVVCMERAWHADSAVCGEGHLVCRDCMEGHVQHCAGEDMRVRRQREGRVPCPHATPALGCTATPYSDAELAQAVSAAAFEAYVRARMEMVESSVREEAEREGEERLRAELARLQALDEAQRAVLAARKHIEEEILTSRCPRCKAAFLDFVGCCALTCHRCPCAFCAWCGADCGTDAHRHVASCGAKPAGAGVYYPREDFRRAQTQRRAGVLRGYLAGLPEATRAALLREMRGTLREDYADVLRAFGQG